MNKVWMKVTITGYYEALTAYYGDKKDNPAAMTAIDQSFLKEHYLEAIGLIEEDPTVTVEPA